MKRYMMTMMVAIFAWTGMNAMDYETAREQAYYLTDKMAYELNLNEQQYNDAYEINLDYLLSIRTEADLLDSRYLAYRNADLRHILYDWQWAAYAAVDYLFNPLRWLNGGWYFPVYRYYAHGYFFYHRPSIFWDYRGGHGRFYFGNGYYYNRRPTWRGGLRGEHRGMIGHPKPGGRYGNPGHNGGFRPGDHRAPGHYDNHRSGNHNSFDARTGRFSNNGGMNRPNNDRGMSNRPGNDIRNNDHGTNNRPESNYQPNTSGRNHDISRGSSTPGSTRGSGISSSSSRGSNFSGSPRTSSSTRGSNFSGGPSSSRGSSFSNSRGGGMTRSAGPSTGGHGHESRGSRGGGRR